jgi:DNA-binding FrmR family transcriptional regulator
MAETDFERFSRIILDEFKRVHERFDRVEGSFDGIGTRLVGIDQRLADVGHEITAIHQQLDTLEGLVQSQSGFAKEIDHLLHRVAAIEKHLGIAYNIKA